MSPWYLVVIIFVILIFVRLVINLYKYKRINYLHKKYIEYLRENSYSFLEYKQEIIGLFNDAGLKDFGAIHQEFLGYGRFASVQISGFDNLASKRADIVNIIKSKFHEAIGVFRNRYKQSLNPIFWVEYIAKFPQFVLESLGVLPEKIISKVVLGMYWIIVFYLGLSEFDLISKLFVK